MTAITLRSMEYQLSMALVSLATKAAMHFLKYSLADVSWLCGLKPQFANLYKGTVTASASQV